MPTYSFRPIEQSKLCTHMVYLCDEAALVDIKKVVAERGHAELYEETLVEKIFLDLGGMIAMDEPMMSVRAGDIDVEVYAIHVDEICAFLDRHPHCADAAHITSLPSRWLGIFISAERATLLRVALEQISEEASRIAHESYRKREEALQSVNRNGLKVFSLPHSHRPPESRN